MTGSSNASSRLFNIGNHEPVTLLTFIEILEKALDRKAIKNFLPMQPGDVRITYADMTNFKKCFDFVPNTPLKEGIEKFVAWYRSRYGLVNSKI